MQYLNNMFKFYILDCYLEFYNMENLENLKKEFTRFLESIDKFETDEKITTIENQEWPTAEQVDLLNDEILPEIKRIINFWLEIIEYVSFSDYRYFYLKDIFQSFEDNYTKVRISISSKNNYDFNIAFGELKHTFKVLKNNFLITNFQFLPAKVEEELNIIVDFIQTNFFKQDLSFSDLIKYLKSQNSDPLNHDITDFIIKFKNNHPELKTGEKQILMRGVYSIYNNYLANNISLEREELINEKNRIEKELADERIKLEQDKNAKLITTFGEKARTMNNSILIFYFFIYGTFSIIIASIFFKMNSNIDTTFKDWHFIYFFSYIAILSTFLTFLIKEKNNLTKRRDYFDRCHVELEALATYTSGFEKEQIIRLKLELAQKYFSAGQNDRNDTLNKDDSPVTNEQFKQILDLIKNLIKK